MGLDSLVRSGIALAKTMTNDLQAAVTLERWTGQDRTTKPTYAPGILVQALIEPDTRKVVNADGSSIVLVSRITILGPLDDLVGSQAGRTEPIDPRDKITLPDGTTCPIHRIDGVLIDPVTSAPYMLMVSLVR